MCGIAGFVDAANKADSNEYLPLIRGMSETLRHRGPDAGGEWLDVSAGVALGHRRLSVIDISETGRQPMISSCGRFVISYNGEIYNFKALRQELDLQQATPEGGWRGHSDTEVLLAAVCAWGVERTLAKLNGMFAFALWDRREQCLYLGRDRLGEKPLYYGFNGRFFLFGSELKALKAHGKCHFELNRDAVALLLRYSCIPAPYSIYKDIFKLPPATFVRLTSESLRRGERPVPECYWNLKTVVEAGSDNPLPGDETSLLNTLDLLLRDSVRLRMEADVPFGAFLSGGVDSSLVVALMQQQSPLPVKTFTIGFHEQGYDEAGFARKVAKHLGTDHTEHYVLPGEALAVIPNLPALYDEPFSDSSQIPTCLVSRLAREKVTVSLSGDGGDEIFGGYPRYLLGDQLWRKIGWLPLPLRRALARTIPQFPTQFIAWSDGRLGGALGHSKSQRTLVDRLSAASDILVSESSSHLYRRLVSHWKDPSAMVHGSKEPSTVLTDPAHRFDNKDLLAQMMYLDTLSYLPDDILVKVDRATMGVALEARVPFLDHRVLELAWRMPLSLKIRDGEGKWLLHQLLARYVPPELTRRPKMGFGVPLDSWLRGPLREWAEELLAPDRLKHEGIFVSGPIEKKWAEHLSGRRDWHYYLWDVLMFQAWWEQQ